MLPTPQPPAAPDPTSPEAAARRKKALFALLGLVAVVVAGIFALSRNDDPLAPVVQAGTPVPSASTTASVPAQTAGTAGTTDATAGAAGTGVTGAQDPAAVPQPPAQADPAAPVVVGTVPDPNAPADGTAANGE